MKTTLVVFLLPLLSALVLSETDVDNKRKLLRTRRASAELPIKRRWKGKMYSKLRKDESPPPTNNQLAPNQYDVTPKPGGDATAAAFTAAPGAGRPTGGASPYGARSPYGAQSPYGQRQPYPQQPFQQPYPQQQPFQQHQRYPQRFPQNPMGGFPGQQPGFGQGQMPQGQHGKGPNGKGPQQPPGGAGGGCGTATVCGSFSISKEDPASVIAPPPRLVMSPMQQPCMPPMQQGCGGMMPPMMPPMQQPCMPPMQQGCGGMMPPMQQPMCPSICHKKCMVTCPRACCTKKEKGDEQENKHAKCPAICAVYCAPQCPHNCCGPGGARRSYIPQAFHASQLSPPALFKLEQEAGDLKRH